MLRDAARRIGWPVLLIPTTDVSAVLVADHAAVLREHFLFRAEPSGLVHALVSKKEMFHLANRAGLPTPQAWSPQSRQEVRALLPAAAYPLMLKQVVTTRSR